mgnify:CR=1 FL=1
MLRYNQRTIVMNTLNWAIFAYYSARSEHQARLGYTPDINSPRPVTILTRRITYPMRMPYGKRGPYHKRNKSKVGVA